MNNSFVSTDVAVEVAVVFAKAHEFTNERSEHGFHDEKIKFIKTDIKIKFKPPCNFLFII